MNQSSRLAIKLSFQSSCQGSQAVIVQGGKKSVFLVKKAITHLKSNRKGKSWCVSENSVYMLQAYMTKLLHGAQRHFSQQFLPESQGVECLDMGTSRFV